MAKKLPQLKIGDKTYTLKLTLGSFVKFQEKTGKNPFQESLMEDFDPVGLRTLLYCFVVEEIEEETLNNLELKEMQNLMKDFENIFDSEEITKKK